MVPAHERLEALQALVGEVEHGLIEQPHLAALERVCQVSLQAQALVCPLLHARLEQPHRVLAASLDGVHRCIGVAQQLLEAHLRR